MKVDINIRIYKASVRALHWTLKVSIVKTNQHFIGEIYNQPGTILLRHMWFIYNFSLAITRNDNNNIARFSGYDIMNQQRK